MAKKSIRIVQTELNEKYGDQFIIVSKKYVNVDTPIKVYCDKCKNIISRSPYTIVKYGCSKCNIKKRVAAKRKDKDAVQRKISENWVVNLEEYVNNHQTVSAVCKTCGEESTKSVKALISNGCKHCYYNSNDRKRGAYNTFAYYLAKINTDSFCVTSDIELDTKVSPKDTIINRTCKTCGNSIDIILGNACREKGCSVCAVRKAMESKRLTQEQFKVGVIEQYGADEWDLSEAVYKTSRTNVVVTHKACNTKASKQAGQLLSGAAGCQVCQETKGEKAIRLFLEKLGLDYTQEATFDDCRSDKNNIQLKFDVYVPEFDLIIEFHGEQHKTYNKFFFKTKARFGRQLELDAFKAAYAIENHNYLEIWYNQIDEIEELIEQKINKLTENKQM